MQKFSITCLLSLSFLVVTAQQNPENYAATITADDLKKHLTIVASAEMEGRETATEGQKKAAAYIEDYFKSIGLKPGHKNSYQQVFPLIEDSIITTSLRVGKRNFESGKDYMVSARTNSSKKIKSRRIVFAGYGIDDSLYSDYRGLDVKGAVVVLALGEPKENGANIIKGSGRYTWGSINRKIEAAAEKGAAAILVLSGRMVNIDPTAARTMSRSGTYFISNPESAKKQPNVANISHEVFREIFGARQADSLIARIRDEDKFAQADYKVVKKKTVFNYKESMVEKANSSNVIAVLEGSDKKDEYVFVTAHYDHIGKRGAVINYGADDDGSGTVSVLEMAEAFAKAKAEGNGPRRSIVFMTVSGEEKGLWGSEYYADHPSFPLAKTTVDLNIDMVGRIDPKRKNGDSLNYVYVIGDNKLSSDLKPISESVNKKFTNLELDYKYNDPNDTERIYYRSDHYNFARKGVPIIFYFNGTHADYHRPTDTVDKINFKLMEKRVHLIFHTAWEIANREEMLKRDLPLN
jgi:hypothetical protein